jgi:hypothetical protein
LLVLDPAEKGIRPSRDLSCKYTLCRTNRTYIWTFNGMTFIM